MFDSSYYYIDHFLKDSLFHAKSVNLYQKGYESAIVWLNDRWAIEGTITDISTSSPFDRSDFPDVPGYSVPRPHNVHTTVGVRFKF